MQYWCKLGGVSSASLSATSSVPLRAASNGSSYVSLCRLLSVSLDAALMYP